MCEGTRQHIYRVCMRELGSRYIAGVRFSKSWKVASQAANLAK